MKVENLNDVFKKIKDGKLKMREEPPTDKHLWNDWVNDKIIEWIEGDEVKRNIVFNELYPVFDRLCRIILSKYSISSDRVWYNDYIQDMIIFLNAKVLPKLSKDKVITSQQYIYISLLNYCKMFVIRYNKYKKFDTEILVSPHIDWLDTDICLTDIHIQIIERIDYLLDKQKIINKKFSMFLIYLKDYLIKNRFDGTGFKDYICKELDITPNYYQHICSKYKIKTGEFNRKIIK